MYYSNPQYFSYYDWTYILIIIAFIFTLIVQMRMKSTVNKYKSVPAASGLTGAQAAKAILNAAGLSTVGIKQIPGELTDHYDPRTNTVSLSTTSCSRSSIAAIGIAAHECGHAMQEAEGYLPLRIRTSLVPVTNISSALAWPLFLIGFALSLPQLVHAGVYLFVFVVLFHLVTLPLEIDASKRALTMLEGNRLLVGEELKGAKAVLKAAAMTYVAALLTTLLTFIRLVFISGGRRRD